MGIHNVLKDSSIGAAAKAAGLSETLYYLRALSTADPASIILLLSVATRLGETAVVEEITRESTKLATSIDDVRHSMIALYALYERLVPPGDILASLNSLSLKIDALNGAVGAMADLALTEEQATEIKDLLK